MLCTLVCSLLKGFQSILGDTLPETNRNDLESLKRDRLYAAIRTQANFLEITPWALMLGALAELNGARRSTLNYAFATLFVLRFWHGEGGIMSVGRRGLGRFFGYWGSMIWMVTIGILNLNLTRPVWSWD